MEAYQGSCSYCRIKPLSLAAQTLECIPHNLGRTVGTLEDRAAIYRDLDKLQKWAVGNLKKFNKCKSKILSWEGTTQHHWMHWQLCRKGSWGCWWTSQALITTVPKLH